MTLARCKTALLDLINDPENRVIALSGRWGTGKTHLWQQVRKETGDAQAKEAVSASLFGVSTIMELKLKIAEGLAPKLRQANFETIKAGVSSIKKVLKGVHSSFSALDELSLLAMPYMLKGRFIVIDDIERKHSKLSIDEILGFIDECVQSHQCRILLVLNSDKLRDHEIWAQIREKVVDQEIKLETSPAEAFDIAQAITPCPWPEQFRLALEPLQITNIRILRKIIRTANQLLRSDSELSARILNRVLPSIGLLSAIHYQAVDNAPTPDFILTYDATNAASIIHLRKNQLEPLTEDQQNHDRWHQFMMRVGIAASDELEGLILAFLVSGILDSSKIRDVVRHYLQQEEHLEARHQTLEFLKRYNWHPELSDEDLIREIKTLLPLASKLHTGLLSSLITVADEVAKNQSLGLALFEAWREAPKAQNHEDISDSSEHSYLRQDHLHPLIQLELERQQTEERKRLTFLEVCRQITNENQWSSSRAQFIRSLSALQLESEIRAASGPDLQLLLQCGFDLVNGHGGLYAGLWEASDAFLHACDAIIHHDPESRLTKIIKREFRAAGLLGRVLSVGLDKRGPDVMMNLEGAPS